MDLENMEETDVDLSDWEKVEDSYKHSTVAYFETGWVRHDGKEVLVWRGVEQDGEVHLEGYEGEEGHENAKFVVEVHYDGQLKDYSLCESRSDASSAALKKIVAIDEEL